MAFNFLELVHRITGMWCNESILRPFGDNSRCRIKKAREASFLKKKKKELKAKPKPKESKRKPMNKR